MRDRIVQFALSEPLQAANECIGEINACRDASFSLFMLASCHTDRVHHNGCSLISSLGGPAPPARRVSPLGLCTASAQDFGKGKKDTLFTNPKFARSPLTALTGCLLPVALLCPALNAKAQTTLNFENLSNPPGAAQNLQGTSVTQNGFTVADQSGGPGLFSVTSTPGFHNYTNSVALYNGASNGITNLTHDNGVPFSLNSIDIANLNSVRGDSVGDVTFTGNLQGGGTVTQSFLQTSDNSVSTVVFGNGFANLTSVSFNGGSPATQFDNVVLNGVVAITPEPGGLALLIGLSLSGAGVLLRRRRGSKAA